MDKDKKEEGLTFLLPNRATIPCLHCKWGAFNACAFHCVKFEMKPTEVYFESKDCPEFTPIKK